MRSPDNSLLVACGGGVVVAAVRNVVATDGVAAAHTIVVADDVVATDVVAVADGVVAAVGV